MADYSVYLRTLQNKIAEAQDIDCANDREALCQRTHTVPDVELEWINVLDYEPGAAGLIQALGSRAPGEASAYAADLRRRGKILHAKWWQAIAEAADRLLHAGAPGEDPRRRSAA
jgi:hypothetical protein